MKLSYIEYRNQYYPDYVVYYLTISGQQFGKPLFSLKEVQDEMKKLEKE